MEKTIELLIIIMLLSIMAEIYMLVKPRRHADSGTQLPILVDTSVLMDGRVVHDFSAFLYSKFLAVAYGGGLGESKNTEVVLPGNNR